MAELRTNATVRQSAISLILVGQQDENQVSDISNQDLPEGGYGWVCVACCFTINCFTWGVVSSYGVYLSYYLSGGVFPGATALDYAFIGGLTFGAAMIVAPLVTIWTKYTSMKVPMVVGAAMLGGAFIAASYASQIWHLYLSQGVLLGIGVGFLYIPSLPVLSQWFDQRRSLANGISSAGSGIGGLIFSFAIEAMIDHLSLAWSLRITGIVTLFMNTLATAFIRNRNVVIQPQQRPFDRELLCRAEVLLLLAWSFTSMLGYITLLYSLSDFALSIGLSRDRATQITAILNAGTAIGRPFIGVASDRLGRFEIAASLTFLCGLCCFAIWIPDFSFGVTTFFALIAGAILGVFWVVSLGHTSPNQIKAADELDDWSNLCRSRWFEAAAITSSSIVAFGCAANYVYATSASLRAWNNLLTRSTILVSEVISLYLRRPGHPRAYLYPQIFCGLCYMCASVCLWCVRLKVKRRNNL